jgi:hypothetical protein
MVDRTGMMDLRKLRGCRIVSQVRAQNRRKVSEVASVRGMVAAVSNLCYDPNKLRGTTFHTAGH